MTQPTKLRTHLELEEIFTSVEERLHPDEAAVLVIASPKEGGGTHISLSMNCSDAIVQAALTHVLRGYDEKVEIVEGGTH
ncbi:hypothetical protein OGR47_12065 [Methylocystis sp. MJC1]|jgi:hypothetical protein|uniref:hypothetical protein n=1 Tax=Methylocystis sp. MJC1 TaxID=2654282 RepID=UPI0013EAD3CC|nr:hypothetical protein [Methylocystis sp. MJC1]KAF2990819.1 hypothetical protein MJC1_01916 [Methylocystis sp. MJC1]MBU6527714.1 hypothetical protein [Methylocystis sp. MJC1]UZX10650.1 hypothetical protein OGR47_12065 [Methylocystis sp. MJC1]